MIIATIDLHTHILPYMDDGAQTVEEAYELIALLVKQGVKGAACTSHFDPSQERIEDYIKRRESAMALLSNSNIPLYLASETFLHESLLYYESLRPLCIKESQYLLLELPFTKKWVNGMFHLIAQLMLRYDIIPIIAHPERYPACSITNIKKLKELGCVMQLNGSSLLNKHNRRKARKFIKHQLIDVIGSDCHNCRMRPPQFDVVFNELEGLVGQKYCKQLMQNANTILTESDLSL